MAERYLALDLGAESGRAMVGTFDGERLSVAEGARFQAWDDAYGRFVQLLEHR